MCPPASHREGSSTGTASSPVWTLSKRNGTLSSLMGGFSCSHAGRDPISIALELDRSTEDQKAWRHEIAAYAVAAGPYRQAFETDNLTNRCICRPVSHNLHFTTA
jgi:hypothetical protein